MIAPFFLAWDAGESGARLKDGKTKREASATRFHPCNKKRRKVWLF